MEKAPLTILEEFEAIGVSCAVSKSYYLKDAAEVLGMDLSTLWEKRRKYGIPKPPPGSVPRRAPLTREEFGKCYMAKLAERFGLHPPPSA